MYGTPGCLLSGPSCHNGMPARACPTTLAHFASRAFVARSDDVIPPLSKTRESAMKTMLKGKQVKDKNGLTIITESNRRERERSLIIRQNIHVYYHMGEGKLDAPRP